MELYDIKNRALVLINEPISLHNCSDILILHANINNRPNDVGIYLYRCSNVIILNCTFSNVQSGVYVDHCTNSITVNNCTFKNMLGPFPRGQAVQFNNFNGFGGVVCDNTILNYPGASHPEDAISIYQSNGTKDSPILITGNKIRGGGPSASGGGIMLGDKGGSWQVAQQNVLVDPGQYGMAIVGGDNNSLLDNLIYGKAQPFTNVGLYVKDWDPDLYPITNFTVRGNKIKFYKSNGMLNNWWFGFGTQSGVVYDPSLTDKLIAW